MNINHNNSTTQMVFLHLLFKVPVTFQLNNSLFPLEEDKLVAIYEGQDVDSPPGFESLVDN